ncbi:glycoside hydrolase family 9 protein [Agaribacterium sp. ZY112]|uniref:glycoside hydrolase family 9 protein n=1 Tax=Agaribacterium sp. ZY112 TaxID=3233574 RepID=UPI0035251FDF
MKNFFLKSSLAVAVASAAFSAQAATPNYGEALQKSIYFYEAQQGGVLPSWNRVEWRADAVLNDGADVGVDLSGGWFDAGDHVKFGFPMAASATMLAWGVIENPEAYEQTGQMKHIKNNLRFVADYFVNAHPSDNVLYGQVGTGSDDHAWWGSPEVVHLTSRAASNRPSYKIDENCPGSDLAGETSAALAAISMIFQDDDPAYSAKLKTHAESLYQFAHTYQGKYSDCITDATAFYNSWSGYKDELVWSSIWMYRATGEQSYLDAAKRDYANLNTEQQSTIKSYKWTHAWDDKGYGSYVLMAKLTGEQEYRDDAERWLDYWSTGYEGQRVNYTAGGLAQLDTWGATRYAANTSLIALIYSDYLKAENISLSKAQNYYDFAVGQMEYIMGDNPAGHSFQIGMSDNGPKNPHHRGAHGTWADSLTVPAESRHLLVGALVGGPGTGDAYSDDRGDYIANEVATDYNSGFTGALARLYLDFGGDPIPENQFPAPEVRDDEFFIEAKTNATGPRHIEIGARVYNRSAWPATNLNEAKLRYFIDLSAEMAAGYSANDITVSTAYSQASSYTQLMPWGDPADNIYYTEIDFSGVDIFPGGQSDHKKEVQFRLSLPTNTNASDWDNSADPSWDNYSNAYKKAPRIALYDGSTLVWGEEPGASCGGDSGVNCAPVADNVVVSTEADMAVDIMLSATDADGSISSYDVSSPAHGTLSGSGNSYTYIPDMGYFGTDVFTYTAMDNAGGVSNQATISVSVSEPVVPSVLINSPANGSDVYTSSTVSLSFTVANAASVDVLVDGVKVANNLTANSVQFDAPANEGMFTVEVIAQDTNGNDLDASASLELNAMMAPANIAPVADFSSTVTGLNVQVDASASSDADGDQLTYTWDFNGTSASGVNATHSFTAAGTYAIELTVSDGIDSDTISDTVTVSAPVGGGLQCEYVVSNEWNTGYVAVIRLTNNGDEVVNGWNVSWSYPAGSDRTNGWNAVVTGNNPYSASNLSWNAKIEPGQTVEFGMQGSKPNGSSAPVPTVTGDLCL